MIPVRLVAKSLVADDVCEFTFRSSTSEPLPRPDPGAHIDVLTPSGDRRSYSLTSGPDTARGDYVIAVALDPESRGGSRSMHMATEVGATVWVSPATNSFPLRPAAEYLLIAGGIGITPLRSMFHDIRIQEESQVTLVYLARCRSSAPYLAELTDHSSHNCRVAFYATDEHDGARFDLWSVLRAPSDGRLYCCASPMVLEHIRMLSMHWRPSRIHVEAFRGVDSTGSAAEAFTARWQPTGQEVEVAADTTLLDALRAAGVKVAASCRAGTCGACRVRLVAGQVQHRDVVLSDQDRVDHLTACVSRASTPIVIGPAE